MDIDIEQGQRNRNASDAVVGAVKALMGYDFARMTGSTIELGEDDVDATSVCEEFTIRAEDMEKIKPAIIASISDTLVMRLLLRKQEIEEIERAIKLTEKPI